MITWSQWWPWRWARGGRAKAGGITACSSNKDTVGEMGMTVGQACAGHLSPAADPGRAMKMLLLTGLGALFFAYYWDDNFNPASLQGARVLLTGASAGVGEELAYHYARLGSHLVLTAPTEALLQKVVGNCRKLGAPKVFYIAADMAFPEVPERVVRFALDKLGGLDYLVLNHLGAAPAGTRARSAQATRWLMQVNFLSYVQLTSLALPSLTDSKGSLVVVSSLLGACTRGGERGSHRAPCGLAWRCQEDFLEEGEQCVTAQPLPSGAPRPRAHLLLQPLLGGQVRSGQLLWLSPAGAGRAGRECGYHHVRPGPPGSRLSRGGCQGRHEGQGGSRAQGSSGCDPRRRHTCLWRLLPMALPPALPASRLAALPEGLVHPPGSQHHGPRCCLSSEDFPANYPGARTHTKTPLREWRRSRRKSSRQKSKTETNYQHLKTIRTPCATVDSLPGILPGTWKTTPQPSQLSLKI
ncbi:hydroxysteroid 11-beta-dehydrogenase 1-like protein isoform X1 [Camelus dromedarius]|uniref:hydroxysteroid 11-beta-dehydrogenase 1-like protein isoform X1 n=2 Tax=Camelus dromedarius TaxID=9838 RepID=UPI00311A6188